MNMKDIVVTSFDDLLEEWIRQLDSIVSQFNRVQNNNYNLSKTGRLYGKTKKLISR